MRRALGPALVAAAVGALVAVLVLGLRAPSVREPPPARPLAVRVSLEPRTPLFGDLVTARAEVLVDRDQVDSARVRVSSDFGPYTQVGPTAESRSGSGRATSLGFRFGLSCLASDCLPGTVALPSLRVTAPLRNGGTATATAQWPAVAVRPRVSAADAAAEPPRWRIQTALPPVSYRVGPATTANLLTALAAALALAALGLVTWEVVRRERLRAARGRAASRLESALALVRESTRRGAEDRRKALAQLARVLARDGEVGRPLAARSARLAWGRADPSPARTEALADDVERAVTGP